MLLFGFNTQSRCLQLEYFGGFEITSIFLVSDSFIELLKGIQTEDVSFLQNYDHSPTYHEYC